MTKVRRRYLNQRPRSTSSQIGQLLLGAGFVVLLFWLLFSVVRLARAAISLQEQEQRLESVLEAGILNADASELEEIVAAVRADITEINRVVGPFAPLGPYLGWLPVVGPLLADAEPLLDLADAGSEMAVHGLTVAGPILAGSQGEGAALTDSLPEIVATLDGSWPDLRKASLAADRLLAARAALRHDTEYPERLSSLLSRLDENAGLLGDGLKLAQAAPDILGLNGPKTYLVLAQNEDEIRPTGGFISGAGLLTVDQGRIVSLSFENANGVDDWRNKPYDLPPAPFTEFMGMDIFLFRDANFWPDFAQSAAQAQALYTYGRGIPLDGVVAFDQYFLQQLLGATGPLPVPELERMVDASNVISQLREEWGPGGEGEDWINQRKAFMQPLAAAFLAQLDGGRFSGIGYELIEMAQRAAEERHLQLYVADPNLAAILDGTSWSGGMGWPQTGDFLHVADTNLGFNKVNAVVESSIVYQVYLSADGRPTARVDVNYANPASTQAIECQHGTRYDPDTQYESLTSDCYWNYLRVYVPGGSALTWSSQHPVPATDLMSGIRWPGISRSTQSEGGSFTSFDNFILLATGQEATVSFEYTLPETVLESDGGENQYRLHIRKQAGTVDELVTVSLRLPDRASIREVTPRPQSISGDTLTFELSLHSDAVIELSYDN